MRIKIDDEVVDESKMDHKPFAALLPSRKKEILGVVCERMPFPTRLVTFITDVNGRTYATVERVSDHTWITYLVAFGTEIHFDNGHYGFGSELSAVRDMYERAS